MTHRWNIRPHTKEEIRRRDALSTALGLNPIISLLLAQRGIATTEEAHH